MVIVLQIIRVSVVLVGLVHFVRSQYALIGQLPLLLFAPMAVVIALHQILALAPLTNMLVKFVISQSVVVCMVILQKFAMVMVNVWIMMYAPPANQVGQTRCVVFQSALGKKQHHHQPVLDMDPA